jgi:hypothetical protein
MKRFVALALLVAFAIPAFGQPTTQPTTQPDNPVVQADQLRNIASYIESLTAGFRDAQNTIADQQVENARLSRQASDLQQQVTDLQNRPVVTTAQTIYVSSLGDDTNDGNLVRPVKTLTKAVSMVRDGVGDDILLRCGDSFEDSINWKKSGAPNDPLVIGAYGPGPRPKIVTTGTAFNAFTNEFHDVRWDGLQFVAKGRDPSDPAFNAAAAPSGTGIRVVKGAARLAVNNCRFELFRDNMIFAPPGGGGVINGLTVTNSISVDTWSTTGSMTGQGLYCDNTLGIVIDGCVFDHNGWNTKVAGATPNIFRHNVYLSERCINATVTNNYFGQGSSHGIQMRGGGTCSGNVFFNNSIHLMTGGPKGVVQGNLFLAGKDIDDKNPRGTAVSGESSDMTVDGNLMVFKPSPDPVNKANGSAVTLAFGDHTPANITAVVNNNVVWNWVGNGVDVLDKVDGVTITNNVFSITGNGRKALSFKSKPAKVVISGNRYSNSSDPSGKWFLWVGSDARLTFPQFAALSGDTSKVEPVTYQVAVPVVPLEDLRSGVVTPKTFLSQVTASFGR